MATDMLKLCLSPNPKLRFSYTLNSTVDRFDFTSQSHLPKRRRHNLLHLLPKRRRYHLRPLSNSLETRPQPQPQSSPSLQQPSRVKDSPILLDVSGMMCGACVSRVKSVLSSDDRVDSVAVNMLTETAAVRLKPEVKDGDDDADFSVAESLARRLTEIGFEAKRRVSGTKITENVNKWKEMVKKKEELLVKSRERVAFAWGLVALCCGSHASHILHSLGIHVAHGPFWHLFHNSYVKGGLALGALLGPGRG